MRSVVHSCLLWSFYSHPDAKNVTPVRVSNDRSWRPRSYATSGEQMEKPCRMPIRRQPIAARGSSRNVERSGRRGGQPWPLSLVSPMLAYWLAREVKMRRVLLLDAVVGVVVALGVACVGASETFANKTGSIVSGITITFSEKVSITSWDTEIFPIKKPTTGRASTFAFSGGALANGGRFTVSWSPGTATLSSHSWMDVTPPVRCSCPEWQPAESPFGSRPAVSKEVQATAYAYLAAPRECQGVGSFRIPVYVSVPYLAPVDDRWSLAIDGREEVSLTRVDEVSCVGELVVVKIPSEIRVRVVRNGVGMTEFADVTIENGFQAVTLGVSSLSGVSCCEPLPAGFLKGAAVCDVWGYYLYGAGERVHTRDFFAPTCDRLVDAGVSDVYVTSFLEYTQILPLPILRLHPDGGAGAISEKDLAMLVASAHARGLKFHLMYNAYSDTLDMSYLWRATKSAAWIEALFATYEPVILLEAAKAQRCGVDSMVLNWQHGAVAYEGNEALWSAHWKEVIAGVRATFKRTLEYNLPLWHDLNDIADGSIPIATFDGVSSFVFSQWEPGFKSYDDSVTSLCPGFTQLLEQLRAFRKRAGRPLYLEVGFQSTEGYLVKGWRDVSIGLGTAGRAPDFFEQARAYEALFQAIRQTGVVDGVVSYKYHWDDPFGPDLGMNAISRMDLSDSIRNKPAEAVLKRWFAGPPGPTVGLTTAAEREAMHRPWCSSCLYEIPSCEFGKGCLSCALLIDDFEGPALQPNVAGWYWWDSGEKHVPGSDPTSITEQAIKQQPNGNGYLETTYRHNTWMKPVALVLDEFDARQYAGIEVTLWASQRIAVDLETGTRSTTRNWIGRRVSGLVVTTTPKRFRIPFADFVTPDVVGGMAGEEQARLIAFSVFVPAGSGTLCVDDICLFTLDE